LDTVSSVFDTPEVAVNPLELAAQLGRAIELHPRIELRLMHEVTAADESSVTSKTEGHERREQFHTVVNALWENRLLVDSTANISPGRPWLHRLKYGIGFKWPADLPRPPSATIISGPFGEVVSYPDQTTYLTWYPPALRRCLVRSAHPTGRQAQTIYFGVR
jgi:hypothetical protein